MTAAPIALLTDMVSAASISTLAAALGLANRLLYVSDRAALDRLFEPYDAERPWPGRLVAFYSNVIVPQRYLDAMSLEPVNLHPGPPEYPGRRALDFALHDGAREYGVTAHVMTLPVDSGPILAAQRFPISSAMTPDTLRFATWRTGFGLMLYLLPALAAEAPLVAIDGERWAERDCSEAAWAALRANDGARP